MAQLTFLPTIPVFPSTRFQGSKLKIVDWIWDQIKELEFNSALDAFGGTGSVSHMLKGKGKQVFYNDILKFNWYIGLALIENDSVLLTDKNLDFIITKQRNIKYPSFIQKNFKDIYFTDDENRWIDMVVTNIGQIDDVYKKALAYFALFQSCIIKRPFNLFHRKNLYIRSSEVERNFGNKTTWDTPFEAHFRKFVAEVNGAIFSNGELNKAYNYNIFDVPGHFDLVYIDTPYLSQKGTGVDYLDFYHFLEGLVNYPKWDGYIDYQTQNHRFKNGKSVWNNKNEIRGAFDRLFKKFQNSILVISYRSDGIPSIEELMSVLRRYKKKVIEVQRKKYKYVLSQNHSEEVLLIGK
jgi:adenine-specific DNA methylase